MKGKGSVIAQRTMRMALLLSGLPLVAAAPVLADRGGNGNGNGGGGNNQESKYSFSLNEPDPHLGGAVTFTSSYPKGTKNPRIQVMCYQSDALVYGEAGPDDHTVLLGGGASEWLEKGGPASCVADLFDLVWNGNNEQQVTWLGSVSFDAAG